MTSHAFPRDFALSDKYRTYLQSAYKPELRVGTTNVAFHRNFDAWYLVNNYDAHFRAVIDGARKTIIGDRYEIEPFSSSYADKKFAEGSEDIIRRIPRFMESLFAATELPFLGRSYHYVNVREEILDLFGTGKKRVWLVPYEIKHIHPFRFERKTNKDYSIRYEVFSLEKNKYIELSEYDKKCFIRLLNSVEEQNFGGGSPLLNPIYNEFEKKKNLEIEFFSACERFGQGFLTLYLDNFRDTGSKDKRVEAQKQKHIEMLRTAKARHGIVLSSKDKAELVQPPSAGIDMLIRGMDRIDNNVTVLVLGATHTITGSTTGSYNQSTTHENTVYQRASYPRNIIMRGFSETIINNIIWGMNVENWKAEGLGDAKPASIRIPQDKENTPSENLEVLRGAKEDLGLELGATDVYKKLEVPEPTPEDTIIEKKIENIPAPYDVEKKKPLPDSDIYDQDKSVNFEKHPLKMFAKNPSTANKIRALQYLFKGEF